MTLTNESSIAEIAARFNELMGTETEVKSLAKRGKAKLLAKIEELEAAEAERIAEEAAKAEALAAEEAKKVPAKTKAKKEPKPKKEKGPVIRHDAEALLLEVVTHDDDGRPYGHAYDFILQTLLTRFEGAKTTVACLRWYAVHMRERGEKVPNRPRANPNKAE